MSGFIALLVSCSTAMRKDSKKVLNSEEWVTIRDFEDDGSGFTLPRYEAKLLDDVEKEHLESELVLVKETRSIDGHDRMYQLPADIFEDVGTRLYSRGE